MKHGFVGHEDECVVAEFFVEREFVGEQKFVKNARRHQNRFARSHRQRVDVIRVFVRIFLHSLVEIFVLQFSNGIEKRTLQSAMRNCRTPLKNFLFLEPIAEQAMNGRVIAKFLEKNIHFRVFLLQTTFRFRQTQFKPV